MALLISEERLRGLLHSILHGDNEHQRWLKEEIEKIIEECKRPDPER